MNSKEIVVKTVLGTIGSSVSYLLGGWDLLIQSVAIMIALDFLTGLCVGFIDKKLSAEVAAVGFIRKFMLLIALCLAVVIDRVTNGHDAFRYLTIIYIIGTEGLSIIRNLDHSGIKLPPVITEALEKMMKSKDGEDVEQ